MKIPSKITVGGQTLKVELLESIEGSKYAVSLVDGLKLLKHLMVLNKVIAVK